MTDIDSTQHENQPTPRRVGKFRHWRQRFREDAAFIWRKNLLYAGGHEIKVGDLVDIEKLGISRRKLRRLWESNYIELAHFEVPLGSAVLPQDVRDAAAAAAAAQVAPGGGDAVEDASKLSDDGSEPPANQPPVGDGDEEMPEGLPKIVSVERAARGWATYKLENGREEKIRGFDFQAAFEEEHGFVEPEKVDE